MILHTQLVKNAAMTATFYTPWVDARPFNHLHFHMSNVATGEPVGAWTVEESDDSLIEIEKERGVLSASSAAVKVDISAAGRVAATGTGLAVSGANNTVIAVDRPGAWVRLKFTYTSGGSSSSLAQVWAAACNDQ